jgi:hypothetical protein
VRNAVGGAPRRANSEASDRDPALFNGMAPKSVR